MQAKSQTENQTTTNDGVQQSRPDVDKHELMIALRKIVCVEAEEGITEYKRRIKMADIARRAIHKAHAETDQAHARLIAAVEALEMALPFIDGHKINSAHVCKTIRAAIAKAKGE